MATIGTAKKSERGIIDMETLKQDEPEPDLYPR